MGCCCPAGSFNRIAPSLSFFLLVTNRYHPRSNLLVLPDEVLRLILDYLPSTDVIRIDSAITNRSYRKNWLQIIYSRLSPSFKCEKIVSVDKKITLLLVLSDGRIVTSSLGNHYEDWIIRIWNSTGNKCTKILRGHTDSILHLLEVNENILVSSSMDYTMRVWNMENESCELVYLCPRALESTRISVRSSISLGNGRILSKTDYHLLFVWNIHDENDEFVIGLDVGSYAILHDYKEDGANRVITQSIFSQTILIWNCSTFLYEKEWNETEIIHQFLTYPITSSTVVRKKSQVLGFIKETGHVHIWNLLTGHCDLIIPTNIFLASPAMTIVKPMTRRRRNRHNHGPLIYQEDDDDDDDPCLLIFYNDIFVASDLYVLNLQTYQLITLPHPDRIITILPMSNNGKIVTICGDQNLRIFDLFSGECERCRRVNNLKCLASSPSNDKILLSGSFDGKLSFWKQVDP